MGAPEITMARTENVELTVLCMVHRGDEILLRDRVKTDWRGFCFPGGHVEPGESVVDAVIREMREETGLTVYAPKLCGIKHFPIEGGRYLVFFFKTDRFEGQLRDSEEGAVSWVRRTELPGISAVSDFMQMLRVFDDETLTEFQYIPQGDDWQVCLK